ncbi:MAG TPA: hypothetical protein VNG53_02005 [Bacteroidia bacterium]|nr:hypothetical protein [Bacteroidia bacterium]
MLFKNRIPSTRLINWFIILCVIYTNASYQYWNSDNRIIKDDVIGYYGYLPATFIYHDTSLKFTDKLPKKLHDEIWYLTSAKGVRVFKYTCGLAILYSPFFFAAHLCAKVFGYDANGYTVPYKIGLIISCIFYLAVGLFFLRKILSKYFPNAIVSMTCLATVLGTNLFCYVTFEPPLEHVYGFCMFAAFIYYTIKWFEKPSLVISVSIGALAGLISLARPTNIIIVLFFILWDITSISDIKKRALFFLSNYKWIILICCVAFCVWIPQFIYWKQQTGQWLYYSYGSKEGFFFNDPKIIKGLFSYRRGWLLYTPIMCFALIGIFFLRKQLKSFFLPIIVFMPLNLYIIFSWWCWWYGGGFGQRPLIDSYALLAIPMAAFLHYIWNRKKRVRIAVFTLFYILILFNQFQNQQYRYGAIHWDSMSGKAYWGNFGRIHPVANLNQLLDPPDYEKTIKGDR